ncbi:3-hydroxyacyl-CoA dehydrogenase NAD-binding domain-containing protein [Kineosporia sp. NBRC 101731]|uniref:3-hydroxyacyl-CoA dehydrogenase NAD-binding domain-containing protein n=1 Tax=Kineosporia sp. NBRC 101731 TaxID=3032199 RepID=UPI0024A3DDAE|nr:3-hydroxyacyl-CoA dehydrogenase NAD-binding domain-containing protein [Kineosporia sp. NBRC 101731]GLY30306.1 3-hydroxyacyl-CoA dehydrogenase [Kineosporia sp. NBRC 101731]
MTTLREKAEAATPDEVVTQALARDISLPGDAGTLVLITLDNGLDHTRPTSFGLRGLRSLEEALTTVASRAGNGEIVAVAVTGKPFFLAAGADLNLMKGSGSRDEALMVARLGHDVFRRLGELPVPSFAFVNGAALGGGLEIALHCTYRTISGGVPAIALPECFLGLIPGWGGTYLLPNLIGPAAALEVIIKNPLSNNRMLNGPKAYKAGIADAIFEPADFLEQSLFWASAVLRGEIAVVREPLDRSEETWTAACDEARAFADSKIGGAAPAPYRAIELVAGARTGSRDEAFAAEDEALADMATSPELRAGLYAFDLVNKRAKRPFGAPDKSLARKVGSVGVVGAGLMASQLALLFVRRLKVPVTLTDLDQARVDQGVKYVHDEIDKLLLKGRLSPDAGNRLKALVRGSTDKAAFAGADVVIEAVFEDLAVKKQVLAELEAVVPDTCVLLTNTSSLSVSDMAADLEHPERVAGFHFFNPVSVLPLVEVVKASKTDDATLATVFQLGKALKKTCVLAEDAPAFIVNRLLTRMMGEVVTAVDEGSDLHVADDALAPLGLPMSPFLLLNLVGPAIALHVSQTLHGAFPDRFGVSENLGRLVAAGKPAIWSYDASGQPWVDEETAALFETGSRASSGEEIRERTLVAITQEIGLMLDEGVVRHPQDLDLCMIMGAGWPFHLGGITPYLDREGYSERVLGRRFLPAGESTLPV